MSSTNAHAKGYVHVIDMTDIYGHHLTLMITSCTHHNFGLFPMSYKIKIVLLGKAARPCSHQLAQVTGETSCFVRNDLPLVNTHYFS